MAAIQWLPAKFLGGSEFVNDGLLFGLRSLFFIGLFMPRLRATERWEAAGSWSLSKNNADARKGRCT